MYETKVNNGFEVLEIEKGSWVEAIFAKEKPKVEKIKTRLEKEDLPSDNEEEDGEIDLPSIMMKKTKILSMKKTLQKKVIALHLMPIQKN